MILARYNPEPLPGGGTQAPTGIQSAPVVGDWHDPDDGSRVGLAPTFEALDAAALLARARSIHSRHPITDPATGAAYDDDGLAAAVSAWISAAGA